MKNNNNLQAFFFDNSESIQDDIESKSKPAKKLIESNESYCLPNLRVTCLGIATTWKNTKFDCPIRDYLSKTINIPTSALMGKKTHEPIAVEYQENIVKFVEKHLFNINKHRVISPLVSVVQSILLKHPAMMLTLASNEKRVSLFLIIQQERCYL